MKNKKIILSIVASIALIVLIIGATYAYFQAQTGEGAKTDIKINASTVDTLTFETGSAISLSLDQDNFASGKGNQSGTTFAKAILSANNKTNTASKNYYLYLNISKNTFNYTQDTNTPEILLTIKDDAGNEITKINDLTYKTITDGSGATKLYHHDENLVNGAGDNSYRYAGGDKDMHPAYYSCKYNGNDVVNSESETNKFLKGDCLSVSKVTDGENLVYVDKSINKLITGKDTVSWDSVNNKCLTSSGEEVTQSTSGEVNETTCTGYAYLFDGLWMIGLTVEEVGAGEETLYSPASEGVKNFVCFGSTQTPCPTDNLYRIIGVIDGKVKLIKYDYATSALLGTDGDYGGAITPYTDYYKGSLTSIDQYYWNYKNDTSINNGCGSNIWSTSLLNKINLNTNFINNIGSTWANKIATTTWKVGGNTFTNIGLSVPSVAYQNEIVAPAENTTYDAKIGLMYVSDYEFAASPSAWILVGIDDDETKNYGAASANNWMYMGHNDLTISRRADNSDNGFIVSGFGSMWTTDSNYSNGARPTFSLSSSITYVSGSGSMTDPILIN